MADSTDVFSELSELFDSVLREHEFAVEQPSPVERHGGWEWYALKRGELTRYVILSAVRTAPASTDTFPRAYLFEAWAGAETGNRFVRGREAQLSVWVNERWHLLEMSETEEFDLRLQLQRALSMAASRADELTEHDLRDRYLNS